MNKEWNKMKQVAQMEEEHKELNIVSLFGWLIPQIAIYACEIFVSYIEQPNTESYQLLYSK